MKELFINGIGCVSPQPTFDPESFLVETKDYLSNTIHCVEPDYTPFFDAASIRRLSRVAKFAVAAALIALRDSGAEKPGAISTGTGLGLLENSGKFLKSVIEQGESVVSPTPFIQSTHNTVGGLIALITGCHAYNNTFAQKGMSFESALTDARLVMEESPIDNFLIGGFDELTDYSTAIMARMGILRKEPCSNLQLLDGKAKGIIAGEGAAFFVLSGQQSPTSYCRLIDNEVFFGAVDTEELKTKVLAFIAKNGITLSQIDLVITGLTGDAERDQITNELNENLFLTPTLAAYKHLCGEYMTSSAFALWLAAKILGTGHIPDAVIVANRQKTPKRVLIYNTYNQNHSLILLGAC